MGNNCPLPQGIFQLHCISRRARAKGTIEVNAVNKDTYPVAIKVTDRSGNATEVNFKVTIAAAPAMCEELEQQFAVYPNTTEKDEFAVRVEARRRDNWNFSLLDFTGRTIDLGSFDLTRDFMNGPP